MASNGRVQGHIFRRGEARIFLLFRFRAEDRHLRYPGQLLHQPLVPTRNRKLLRANPIASWELRIGEFRVFYEVDEEAMTVTVVAVGHKEHNVLLVRGQEVRL